MSNLQYALSKAVDLITTEFIANEIGFPTYPCVLREAIAQRLTQEDMGWPSVESAVAYLEGNFKWA